MPGTFRCSVVTPEAPVAEEECRHVAIPAWDGSIGILHDRAPLLAKLGAGALRLELQNGTSRAFFVSGGFAQMKDNRLTVLTDEAIPAEQITRTDAEAALREAEARRGDTPAEAERRRKDLDRARAMLTLASQ